MLECPIWSQTYFALSPWPINIDAKKWRFAARTLIHWYRAGLDVERELPKLATYRNSVSSGPYAPWPRLDFVDSRVQVIKSVCRLSRYWPLRPLDRSSVG
jgi:hypothetical protein